MRARIDWRMKKMDEWMRRHVSRCDSEIMIITTNRLPRSARSINHLFFTPLFLKATYISDIFFFFSPPPPACFFSALSKLLLGCQEEIINIVIVHLFFYVHFLWLLLEFEKFKEKKSNGLFWQTPQRLKAIVLICVFGTPSPQTICHFSRSNCTVG